MKTVPLHKFTRHIPLLSLKAKGLLLSILAPFLLSAAAHAEVHLVSVLGDSGPGSLRDTIATAAAGDIVSFNLYLNGGTITLGGTNLIVDKDLTIDAITLPDGITIDGADSSRIFDITSGNTVALRNLTISGGRETVGGGIRNRGDLWIANCRIINNTATATAGAIENAFSNLYIIDSTISGNSCGNASGIYSFSAELSILSSTISGNIGIGGTGEAIRVESSGAASNSELVMINSTVCDNTSSNNNAGISVRADDSSNSSATLVNSTLTNNQVTSAGPGAGIKEFESTGGTAGLILYNTIVSGNTAAGAPSDIDGTVETGVGNLIGVGGDLTDGVDDNRVGITNPRLGPLRDNGGPTLTRMPITGSLAVGNGTDDLDLGFDQRGFFRPDGGGIDIGAVEGVDNSALKAKLTRQIKATRRGIKVAKRKGDKRKLRKLNKKLKTLLRQLRAL